MCRKRTMLASQSCLFFRYPLGTHGNVHLQSLLHTQEVVQTSCVQGRPTCCQTLPTVHWLSTAHRPVHRPILVQARTHLTSSGHMRAHTSLPCTERSAVAAQTQIIHPTATRPQPSSTS